MFCKFNVRVVWGVGILMLISFIWLSISTDRFSQAVAEDETCQAIASVDGSDFNWELVKTNAHFELCLLELALNLETPEMMAVWLENQGFTYTNFFSHNESGITLNANWDAFEATIPRPFNHTLNIIDRLLFGDHLYSVQIVYENRVPIRSSAFLRVL